MPKTRLTRTLVRVGLAAAAALILSGCYYGPNPYGPSYGYGYGYGGYYHPAYRPYYRPYY